MFENPRKILLGPFKNRKDEDLAMELLDMTATQFSSRIIMEDVFRSFNMRVEYSKYILCLPSLYCNI